MFGVAVVPAVLLALGMAFSPESPRWLAQVFCNSMQSFVTEALILCRKPFGKICYFNSNQ